MKPGSELKRRREGTDETPVRRRILDSAFSAFIDSGYAETSMLEIATRARVSKRELYVLVGNKQEMLAACIAERATSLRVPTDIPVPHDRAALARVLETFGAQLLREISEPTVIAVFRLAIAEAVRAPEVARALDSIGREASRAAVREIMAGARSGGILDGEPSDMAEQFAGLLWGTLMVSLLLDVADRPSPREITRRARNAADAFLRLHPEPNQTTKFAGRREL